MPLHSGFFNSFFVNGEYDRRYNADDYSEQMGALIRSGVLRDANNGFRVTASGLVLSISPGRAWIEGRWAYLDEVYILPPIVPPTGHFERIDSVNLVLDKRTSARTISIAYKQGTPYATPVAPSIIREDGVYELVLAQIRVSPNATTVSVTDCRHLEDLCGWVTTPVGYDDFFANYDAEFSEWFREKRTQLAAATLYKQYVWRTVLTSEATTVAFDIPQYDSTGVDIIQVYVNGLLEVEDYDYTLSGNTVIFGTDGGGTGVKIAGTEIVVICKKSIDGTGLGSVSDEITALQNQVAALGDYANYNYVCNGATDNVELSAIAQDFLAGGNDGKILTINVYGTMGITAAYSGEGTTISPFRWFQFGQDDYSTRRVIVDFCNTNAVNITCPDFSNNILFYGTNIDVKNARFDIRATGGSVVGFNSGGGKVYAEKCRFTLVGGTNTYLAKIGTFTDCVASCLCTSGHAQVFNVNNFGVTRIRGGEYYALCSSSFVSAPIYVAAGQPNAVVIAEGCSLPNLTMSGYVQTYGVCDVTQNGKSSYRDIITALNNSATGQLINVIPLSKAEQV